jgi:hypothetical protein
MESFADIGFFLSGTRLTYMESFGDTDFSLVALALRGVVDPTDCADSAGCAEVQEISAGTGSAYREEPCSSP